MGFTVTAPMVSYCAVAASNPKLSSSSIFNCIGDYSFRISKISRLTYLGKFKAYNNVFYFIFIDLSMVLRISKLKDVSSAINILYSH